MQATINPQDLRKLLTDYVQAYPGTFHERPIWRSPLLVTARADDRFDRLPEIAARDHMLPSDLLAEVRSVVVFFFPFKKELAVENHKGDTPCRNWGLAYEAANRLINRSSEYLQAFFEKRGYQTALTPVTHNFNEVDLVARWSHKHLGHLAGLGRFGVNAQLITPSGCAGRMGSLVTQADLGDAPLVSEPELCLYKNGLKCLVCVKRCPVEAVSTAGIDRRLCWERLKSNLANVEALAGLDSETHVCAKCQVLVPCSLKVPPLKKEATRAG